MKKQLKFYENKLRFQTDAFDLMTAIDHEENVIVIDVRSEDAYRKEHIPGSINIPHAAIDESSTKHINKDARIVTYCDGVGCNASTKGALNMTRLGYQVKELIGGLEWWKRDGFPTQHQ